MTLPPKNRFQRYGKTASIDDVIKDCRDLQRQVDSLEAALEELKKKMENQ